MAIALEPLDAATVDQLYSGWTNYKTWNVALWIANDEALSSIADQCDDYTDFRNYLDSCMVLCTPDGVYYADQEIDGATLNNNFWFGKD